MLGFLRLGESAPLPVPRYRPRKGLPRLLLPRGRHSYRRIPSESDPGPDPIFGLLTVGIFVFELVFLTSPRPINVVLSAGQHLILVKVETPSQVHLISMPSSPTAHEREISDALVLFTESSLFCAIPRHRISSVLIEQIRKLQSSSVVGLSCASR